MILLAHRSVRLLAAISIHRDIAVNMVTHWIANSNSCDQTHARTHKYYLALYLIANMFVMG